MEIRGGLFLLITILLVLPATPVPCNAGSEFNHLGKFCFRMISSRYFDPNRSLQLDLYSFGGWSHPVYGNIIWESRLDTIPVYGTAVKDGENIIVTLTGSEYWGDSDAVTLHAVIGKNGGEYNTIEHGMRWSTIPPDIIVSFSDGGTLDAYSCP